MELIDHHHQKRMDLDQYLIHQLNNKFINQRVSIDKLIVANLNDHHPQDFFPVELNDGGMKECYVLTPRNLFFGLRFQPNSQTRIGYWKALGYIDDKICSVNGAVGVKRKLSYFEGGFAKARKTNWSMIEYRLLHHRCSMECHHARPTPDDWVLCKVYEDLDPDDLTCQLHRMDIGQESYMEDMET
ncbi:hypothetical protein ACH5RR_020176 [Cinchona calisaya]|uniref:NAC domain-containing protein n=1 Tax=Cinchona calisaya TaxID=153742 RepID=A0ABD2ZDN5_9GENT